ncbi:MAG: molybdopterin-binding protein [Planctomycetota bacterium]
MKSGTILQVCVSRRKGTVKEAVREAVLREDHGLEGDAHAGDWHRQVSLLSHVDIKTMRAKGLDLEPGAFGENFVIDGLNLDELGIGTRLRSGPVELEITQIGKVCHDRCAIYHRTGDCIMPRAGMFARVLRGGSVKCGSSIEVLSEVSRGTPQAAVVTVSDSRAAGEAEDTAGPAAAALIERELGAHVAWRGVVPDEADAIAAALEDLAARGLDLVATVGGTGCGPRDVTPEATRRVIEREAPGLAEAMRSASARTTPHALLQRGVCGIRGATLILNLPGSPRGATENLAVVLPALPHAVRLLRGATGHAEIGASHGVSGEQR